MSRIVLVSSLLLLIVSAAFAGTVSIDRHKDVAPTAATVSGIVESVSGNIIQLADGLVTIDASGAKIIADRGADGTLADVKPGMLLFAQVASHDVAPNAPIPARVISVSRLADATLFGPVQSVDLGAQTFTVLGRTIQVTADTDFGGRGKDASPKDLNDLHTNDLVHVQTEVTGGKLVATSVLILAPLPPLLEHARGTVKSIGASSWVIAREKDAGDLTLVVNGDTKIVGSPKVGDTVEVLYKINDAHENVAVSIVRFERPQDLVHLSGKVAAISASEWSITKKDGATEKLAIDDRTKIEPGIKVGDDVEVGAVRRENGTLLALLIVKKRW